MGKKNQEKNQETQLMLNFYKYVDDLPGQTLVSVLEENDWDLNDLKEIGDGLKSSIIKQLMGGWLERLPNPHQVMIEAAMDEVDWLYVAKEMIDYGKKKQVD